MIHVESRGHVLLVTMDRPERRNAVDLAGVEALLAAVAGAGEGTRVMVLTGAGGQFCAGADLAAGVDPRFPPRLRALLAVIRTAPFVTMAAVDGAALGAGTQLAVACDLRVASAAASFGIPAGRLGLAVDVWTAERLAALAGHGPARAMLLAAEVVKGDEAHRFGFVQRLGSLEDALAWADDIAALAPLTIRAHKAALEAAVRGGDATAAETAIARAWASDDLREGLAAFHERRPPLFHGR